MTLRRREGGRRRSARERKVRRRQGKKDDRDEREERGVTYESDQLPTPIQLAKKQHRRRVEFVVVGSGLRSLSWVGRFEVVLEFGESSRGETVATSAVDFKDQKRDRRMEESW